MKYRAEFEDSADLARFVKWANDQGLIVKNNEVEFEFPYWMADSLLTATRTYRGTLKELGYRP
jgi:hypothetical protein